MSRANLFLSQRGVTEILCDLLIPNFKNPESTALVKEKIRHTPDGFFSYRAAALNLVLKKKKLKKLLLRAGAKFECVNSHCERPSLVSYSSIGSSVYCASCGFYECAVLTVGITGSVNIPRAKVAKRGSSERLEF